MVRVQTTILMMAATFALPSTASLAQGALIATVAPSGLIAINDATGALATIELNAHGPGWQHAPQNSATGEVRKLPGRDGAQVIGTLPIPSTNGAALGFIETITPLSQGLRLEYDLTVTQAMRLSGLQLSINLPVERYAGSEATILRPHDDPDIAGLPEERTEDQTQLWRGDGATVHVASDTSEAITVELRAATDVVLQDLRQWQHDVFEIRFPAIMEDPGREMSLDDRFHLDLTITFAGPMTLRTP